MLVFVTGINQTGGTLHDFSEPSFPQSSTPDFLKCLSQISESFDSPPSLGNNTSNSPGSCQPSAPIGSDDAVSGQPCQQQKGGSSSSSSQCSSSSSSRNGNGVSPTPAAASAFCTNSNISACCASTNSDNVAAATSSASCSSALASSAAETGDGPPLPPPSISPSSAQLNFDPLAVIAGDEQGDLNVSCTLAQFSVNKNVIYLYTLYVYTDVCVCVCVCARACA